MTTNPNGLQEQYFIFLKPIDEESRKILAPKEYMNNKSVISMWDDSIRQAINYEIYDKLISFCDICQDFTMHLQDDFCTKCQLTKEMRDEWLTPEGFVYNQLGDGHIDH